ncbi:MAG: MarR family transcriptional regulator [Oscillospiraceae bacterium]|nr:MarR family transcriptional regulator [Oscillospiraceae bacterium]
MQTIFEHYAAGERLYSQMVTAVCQRYGLTYMEFTVLMFLANNPQYDRASEVVKYRRLTKSHVSISVRALEEKGLLTGLCPETDRRSIRLKLTAQADAVVSDGRQAQKSFGEAIFHGFTREEYTLLAGFMERIDGNIRRALEAEPTR